MLDRTAYSDILKTLSIDRRDAGRPFQTLILLILDVKLYLWWHCLYSQLWTKGDNKPVNQYGASFKTK